MAALQAVCSGSVARMYDALYCAANVPMATVSRATDERFISCDVVAPELTLRVGVQAAAIGSSIAHEHACALGRYMCKRVACACASDLGLLDCRMCSTLVDVSPKRRLLAASGAVDSGQQAEQTVPASTVERDAFGKSK